MHNPVENNPYDILLIIVNSGYLLNAILTLYLVNNFKLKGILIGLTANAMIHLNVIINGERIFSGEIPDALYVIKAFVFMACLNIILSLVPWYLLGSKEQPRNVATVLGMLISSLFFWNLYLPAIFLLAILTWPYRKIVSD